MTNQNNFDVVAAKLKVAEFYDSLEVDYRAIFLCGVTHSLTLVARACYSEVPQLVTTQLPCRMGEINEAQHRVLGLLLSLLSRPGEEILGSDVAHHVVGWSASPAFNRYTYDQILRDIAWVEAKARAKQQLGIASDPSE